MAGIATRLSQQYPNDDADMSATVIPMGDFGLEVLRRVVWALLAAVGFVLLIACVNIANLLLARGAARQKEFALRQALGAAGSRIARLVLTESLLLALLGGVCGLVLAVWSTRLLPAMFPADGLNLPLRQVSTIPVDRWVLVFTLLVSCLTGILFGLAPALHALRGDVTEPLKDGGRGSTAGGGRRLRHVLVAAEVALALVLLSGAGLMIESMSRLLGVDPGFNPKNVLTFGMSLPQEDLYNGPPGHPRFCQDLDEHVSAVPGVMAVGAVGHLPMEGDAGRSFAVEEQYDPGPGHRPGAHYSVACPNYFKALGVPVLAGREFSHQDTVAAPGVVIINQSMADKYWPKQNPVGRRILEDNSWLTVVGVVGDVRHWGLDNGVESQFFRPYTQAAWPVMTVVVRTVGPPMSFTPAIKKAMSEVEPDRPVSGIETMQNIVQDSLGPKRFPTLLLSGFAMLALVLAAVGILGVVSYSVAQRTHEIGIRMALGARADDVMKLMVSGSMTWVVVGIGVGIAGSLGLTRLLGTLLYDVKPSNPVVLGTVTLLLTCIGLLASYIPARRAAKVDPMVALRYE